MLVRHHKLWDGKVCCDTQMKHDIFFGEPVKMFVCRKIYFFVDKMDGTVMNTLDDLTDAVNYVLGEFGMPLRKQDEYRRFFGNGIRLVLRW